MRFRLPSGGLHDNKKMKNRKTGDQMANIATPRTEEEINKMPVAKLRQE